MSNYNECLCDRKKHRNEDEYKDLINRLNRIEGQVRGVRKMVENDCYCPDIINQVSAISAALNSFNKELLENHIKTCVVENINSDNPDSITELVKLMHKLMR